MTHAAVGTFVSDRLRFGIFSAQSRKEGRRA